MAMVHAVLIHLSGGVNNILPNLDLVYVAVRLCEQEGLNTAFHVPVCAKTDDYPFSFETVPYMLFLCIEEAVIL